MLDLSRVRRPTSYRGGDSPSLRQKIAVQYGAFATEREIDSRRYYQTEDHRADPDVGENSASPVKEESDSARTCDLGSGKKSGKRKGKRRSRAEKCAGGGITAEHVALLESIGTLCKYRDAYYPQTMDEVEFFVKQAFDQEVYRAHYSRGVTVSDVTQRVSKDVQYYGLSAYRNNVQLSDREECILLQDWRKSMRTKYCDGSADSDQSIRNSQLLLSFVQSEIARMCRIECNNRAALGVEVWSEAVGIMRTLEERTSVVEKKLNRKWKAQYEETKVGLEKQGRDLARKLADTGDELRRLKAELQRKEQENQQLKAENAEYRDRYQALSGILDHMSSKSIDDLRKYNKSQKKLMLSMLSKLQRDRDGFRQMFPGGVVTPLVPIDDFPLGKTAIQSPAAALVEDENPMNDIDCMKYTVEITGHRLELENEFARETGEPPKEDPIPRPKKKHDGGKHKTVFKKTATSVQTESVETADASTCTEQPQPQQDEEKLDSEAKLVLETIAEENDTSAAIMSPPPRHSPRVEPADAIVPKMRYETITQKVIDLSIVIVPAITEEKQSVCATAKDQVQEGNDGNFQRLAPTIITMQEEKAAASVPQEKVQVSSPEKKPAAASKIVAKIRAKRATPKPTRMKKVPIPVVPSAGKVGGESERESTKSERNSAGKGGPDANDVKLGNKAEAATLASSTRKVADASDKAEGIKERKEEESKLETPPKAETVPNTQEPSHPTPHPPEKPTTMAHQQTAEESKPNPESSPTPAKIAETKAEYRPIPPAKRAEDVMKEILRQQLGTSLPPDRIEKMGNLLLRFLEGAELQVVVAPAKVEKVPEPQVPAPTVKSSAAGSGLAMSPESIQLAARDIRKPGSRPELMNEKNPKKASSGSLTSLLSERPHQPESTTSLISAAGKEVDAQQESEEIHDFAAAVKLEDPGVELPKKLMAVISRMSDQIARLDRNEYGEWLLDITQDSDLVRRILKNGHLLTLLLRHLYKKGITKSNINDSSIRIYDMGVQTEPVYTAETYRKLTEGEGTSSSNKIWHEEWTQTTEPAEPAELLQPTRNHMGRVASPNPTRPRRLGPEIGPEHGGSEHTGETRPKFRYSEAKQLLPSSLGGTTFRPFQIGRVQQLVRQHPAEAFVSTFLEKLGMWDTADTPRSRARGCKVPERGHDIDQAAD